MLTTQEVTYPPERCWEFTYEIARGETDRWHGPQHQSQESHKGFLTYLAAALRRLSRRVGAKKLPGFGVSVILTVPNVR